MQITFQGCAFSGTSVKVSGCFIEIEKQVGGVQASQTIELPLNGELSINHDALNSEIKFLASNGLCYSLPFTSQTTVTLDGVAQTISTFEDFVSFFQTQRDNCTALKG